jgi:hypothetical protein
MLRALKAAPGQSFRKRFREAYDRLRRTHELIRRVNAPGDGPNNLVILDYDTPTPMTPDNMPGHFLFGLEAVHVHTVIAQGRIVVENRRLVSHDEADILALHGNKPNGCGNGCEGNGTVDGARSKCDIRNSGYLFDEAETIGDHHEKAAHRHPDI